MASQWLGAAGGSCGDDVENPPATARVLAGQVAVAVATAPLPAAVELALAVRSLGAFFALGGAAVDWAAGATASAATRKAENPILLPSPAFINGEGTLPAVPRRDDNCLFCSIAAGEEDAHIVFEDDATLAFLDNRPLFPGHALLIPREHHETLADLPAELVAPMFTSAQLLSRAIPEAMEKPGSFVAMNNVVSQSVPHLHVHVVPRLKKDGLRGFFWPRTKYASDAEAKRTAAAIRAAIKTAD